MSTSYVAPASSSKPTPLDGSALLQFLLSHTYNEAMEATGFSMTGLRYRVKNALARDADTAMRSAFAASRKQFQGRRLPKARPTRGDRPRPSRVLGDDRPVCPPQQRDESGHYLPLPADSVGCRRPQPSYLASDLAEKTAAVQEALTAGNVRLAAVRATGSPELLALVADRP